MRDATYLFVRRAEAVVLNTMHPHTVPCDLMIPPWVSSAVQLCTKSQCAGVLRLNLGKGISSVYFNINCGLLLFFLFFLATQIHMWVLSSLTRDQSNLQSLHLKCRVTISEQPGKTLIMVLNNESSTITLDNSKTHVHWVDDAIQPSHLLLSPFSPTLNVSQHTVFSSESVLHIRGSKYWSFNFSFSPSNEYSRFISFRIDWFDLLSVQGILKCHLQHHSLKVSILWCSAFIMVQISYPWASSVAQLVKNSPAMRETWVQSLGWEDPLEKGKATHSSFLA